MDSGLQIEWAERPCSVELCALQRRSAIGLAATHYSAEQLGAWERLFGQVMALASTRIWTVAARDDAVLVGFGQLVDSHTLGSLYVDPAWAGRGVGTALLHALEERATLLGWPRLLLEASLNAVTFYSQVGYVRLGSHVGLCRDGTTIPTVRMIKALAPACRRAACP